MLLLHEQRSPEWFACRKGKITASLAAAVLSLDPYKGPLAAYNEIVHDKTQDDNEYMKWGRENEAHARDSYEVFSGNLVAMTGFWVHDTFLWLGASPDGLVGTDGLVELKCPTKLPTEIPSHHEIQVRVQLACTDRAWCDYYTWVPGQGEFCKRVERDSGWELWIITGLQEWYEKYVLTGTPPPRRRKKPDEEAGNQVPHQSGDHD